MKIIESMEKAISKLYEAGELNWWFGNVWFVSGFEKLLQHDGIKYAVPNFKKATELNIPLKISVKTVEGSVEVYIYRLHDGAEIYRDTIKFLDEKFMGISFIIFPLKTKIESIVIITKDIL